MKKSVSDKLEAFYTQYKKQTYKKGEILIRVDEEPSGIFFLSKGTVKMYSISAKGDEIVLNLFKPLSFFPMTWAINGTKNAYYYEALDEITFHKVPREDVLRFLNDNPIVLFDLLSRVYRGMDGVLTRMAYLMSGNAHSRLITELLIAAKRFGVKGTSGELTISMSEKDLATQAGLTRETVSREMRTLKEHQLVSMDKRGISIKNIKQLEEELSVY